MRCFSRGALYRLLQNRLYLGEIPHGRESYPGAHPPIVPEPLFEAVQARLASQRRARREPPLRSAAMPLTGLLFDVDGHPMSPSFGYGRGGKLYRYYVSAPLNQGQSLRQNKRALRRISATALESRLQSELSLIIGKDPGTPLAQLLRPVRHIELERDELRLQFSATEAPRDLRRRCAPVPGEPNLIELALPISCQVRGGRTWVVAPAGRGAFTRRDPVLIRGLRQAHRIAADLGWRMADGVVSDLGAKSPAGAYDRRLCRLAFLAPEIQKSILDGKQPPALALDALLRAKIPLDWSIRRQVLGFN